MMVLGLLVEWMSCSFFRKLEFLYVSGAIFLKTVSGFDNGSILTILMILRNLDST